MKDQILNRWAAGEGAGMIAKSIGQTRAAIYWIVWKARSKGDPRAISHAEFNAGTDKWRSRYTRKGRGWELTP